MNIETNKGRVLTRIVFTMPFLMWLGGAVHVSNQPGCDFWDGLIWIYYVGRYFATNFTIIH